MIVFVLVWTIAVAVLVLDHKSPLQRWFSAAAFLDGLYGFHFAILEKASYWLSNPSFWFYETILTYITSLFLFPYAFLMAAIYYYTDIAEEWKEWRKPLAFILLIPVVGMYGILLFWLKDFNDPKLHLFRKLWVVPYYLSANSLLAASYFRARSRRQKNDSFFVCAIIIPISLTDLTLAYILAGFGISTKKIGSYLIIILFMSFSCIVTRYGLLGRKLQIEKLRLDSSIKTMTSGAAILNHSIKNEIAKIAICASNLKTVGENPAQIRENAQIMLRSIEHILRMIERTSQCTRDFILEKTPVNLKVFLEEILAGFDYQFLEKKIQVTTDFNPESWITADELHLREVINNLIRNAIEAMESGGKLELKVVQLRATVSIIIKDSGVGIPNEILPHIYEPFFTTKNPRRNFGLGLLYCYQVLKKHGGRIEIESEPGKGTTLYLEFPRSNLNRFRFAKGALNVTNKSVSG